jgi:predicted Rossmann fold flavoprotein
MRTDLLIIGAGASGLICGITAGRRGRSVMILDHSQRTGNKIRISGGGRCNFTNLSISPSNYISANPDFCRSALSRFGPDNIIEMLKQHGITFREKESGQLFCERSSSLITGMLEEECRSEDISIAFKVRINEISKKERFSVTTDSGTYEADSLVIATGGLSYPNLGASDLGLRIARNFGLSVIAPRPGLVPLTLDSSDLAVFRDLSGVSIDAEVRCGKRSFRGGVLFTHRGLSGPAILQISSYWKSGDQLIIDLLPGIDADELLISNRSSRKNMQNFLSQHLPSRFVNIWCSRHLQNRPLYQYNEKELRSAAEMLSAWKIVPSGTEGYKSAEVTVGGVDTAELSSKTMGSKKVPGLYFIGEVVDVTGQLGGYNLHWAWASGHAAGQYA